MKYQSKPLQDSAVDHQSDIWSDSSKDPHRASESDLKHNNQSIQFVLPQVIVRQSDQNSRMPNVPQCKGKTSDDDDNEYDELYSVSKIDSSSRRTPIKDFRQEKSKCLKNMNTTYHETDEEPSFIDHSESNDSP